MSKLSRDNIYKEISFDIEEDKSFSFDLNIEEKYNKLYSNFEVKERKYDCWESINNKINHKKNISNKLNKLHHLLDYKNYQIFDNNEFSFRNCYNNNLIQNNTNKKGRNKKTIINLNKSPSMNSIPNKENMTYELNLDPNKVYNRLYNRGFYVKNKIMVNKIKSDEIFSKSMSESNYINPYSAKILLFKKNIYNNKIKKMNKSMNYYKEDETFKPNLDKNSLRIANRLQKRKNIYLNEKTINEISFNNDKKKINKIKYDIFRNKYINLFNYINKDKYSNYNKSFNKTPYQRVMNLHKRNIELYKNKKNEIEKNNNDDDIITKKNNVKLGAYKIYENNKKWQSNRDAKIKKFQTMKEKIELSENRKDLDLPGKLNYEKYKNLIIKVFSPKEKINKYSLIKKKNNTHINNIINNSQKNEIKTKENQSNSKNKLINHNRKYHRQNLKYVNNEGKELALISSYFNHFNDNNLNAPKKKNNTNFSEFTKLVKENHFDIKDINDKNKEKSKSKINKIKENKNSLEYKLKHIKMAFNKKNEKKKKLN